MTTSKSEVITLKLNRLCRSSIWCKTCDTYSQCIDYHVNVTGICKKSWIEKILYLNAYLLKPIVQFPDSLFPSDFNWEQYIEDVFQEFFDSLEFKIANGETFDVCKIDLLSIIIQHKDEIKQLITDAPKAFEAFKVKADKIAPTNRKYINEAKRLFEQAIRNNDLSLAVNYIIDLNTMGYDPYLHIIGIMLSGLYVIRLHDILPLEIPDVKANTLDQTSKLAQLMKKLSIGSDTKKDAFESLHEKPRTHTTIYVQAQVLAQRLLGMYLQRYLYQQNLRTYIVYRQIYDSIESEIKSDLKSKLKINDVESLEECLYTHLLQRNPTARYYFMQIQKERKDDEEDEKSKNELKDDKKDEIKKSCETIYNTWRKIDAYAKNKLFDSLPAILTAEQKATILPHLITKDCPTADRIEYSLKLTVESLSNIITTMKKKTLELTELIKFVMKNFTIIFNYVYFPGRQANLLNQTPSEVNIAEDVVPQEGLEKLKQKDIVSQDTLAKLKNLLKTNDQDSNRSIVTVNKCNVQIIYTLEQLRDINIKGAPKISHICNHCVVKKQKQELFINFNFFEKNCTEVDLIVREIVENPQLINTIREIIYFSMKKTGVEV